MHRVNGSFPESTNSVVRMFERIAGRYDRTNRVLSLGRDRAWRTGAAGLLRERPAGGALLDVAAGTGDFAAAIVARRPELRPILLDPSPAMLQRAREKKIPGQYVLGVAERLPFRTASADVVSAAFGIRNFRDPGGFLDECARVLKPGGELLLLEFSLPRTDLHGRLLGLLLPRFVPRIGRLVAGDGAAYAYLARSIPLFDAGFRLQAEAERAGFRNGTRRAFFFGLVAATRWIRS